MLILVRPIVPVIGYAINYNYIASVLCINKQKPKLDCNGKCFLIKQLAKDADAEKPASRDKKSVTWEFEFTWHQKVEPLFFTFGFVFDQLNKIYRSNLHPLGWKSAVFRPPVL